MSAPILELTDVTKRFGGLAVVEDVSLCFQRGACTAVIGPNGAGKTMLFNLVSGVYTPSSGAILIDCTDVTAYPARRRAMLGLSRTFQNIRLMDRLTVLDNVLLGQHVHAPMLSRAFLPRWLARNGALTREAIEELDRAGLAAVAYTPVASLSYGVRKQVELVRALLSRPRLLLLDEPAAGLNSVETEGLRQQLQEIIRRDITLIMVEHDMGFVGRLAEHVVVLNFGRVIAEGSMPAIRRNEAVREAYLGTDEQDAA